MTRLRSINFDLMVALGVGLGMEYRNYMLVVQVGQLNMEVVQFCVVLYDFLLHEYICKIEGKMTQGLYISILQDGVIKTIKWYRFNPSRVVSHYDNDLKHTTKLVKKWLSMQMFYILAWPTQSSDLNPLEHVWRLVKGILNEHPTPTNECFNCGSVCKLLPFCHS